MILGDDIVRCHQSCRLNWRLELRTQGWETACCVSGLGAGDVDTTLDRLTVHE